MKVFRFLPVAALVIIALSTQAQTPKLGHINSAELLQLLPEVKKADTTLQAYQKALEDQNQTMLQEYQTQVADYQKLPPTTSDAVKEVKEGAIKDLQDRIQEFQQSAQDKFANKKEEIYGPILKKAEDAIKEVAKENNYAYVFDTSAGAVIYAQDSDNIMDLVKKKLGLK